MNYMVRNADMRGKPKYDKKNSLAYSKRSNKTAK